MANTPNYNLTTYSSSDTDVRFLDFRVAIAGSQTTSNFYKIDTALKQHTDAIASLEASPSAFTVNAVYSTDNFYTASVTNYPGYKTNQLIALSLDRNNVGTVTININGSTTKSVMKYNTSGLLVNAADNDFVKNNPVLCIYDGTQFIMLGSSSATNIRIDGAANHVVMISGQNTLVTSGRGIGIANGFATLDASGKLVQTAKNSDYATTAGIANTVLDGSIVTNSFNSAAVAPTAAKTSQALTIQLNGTAQPTFNGSTARTINVTPASIGAATTGALDGVVSDLTDGTTVVAQANKVTNALVIMSNSGTALVNYDGSATANMTLSPSNVGAEPAFTKNTAFNKNFGSSAGTVCQGNDSRLSNARRSSNISMSLSGTNLSISYS
jgi:hypothetical protein|nr:MAG TPA: hypothetical protein [Caudoviricetes sp.]